MSVKDVNLLEESTRMTNEIDEHKYMFDRQEK